MKTIYFISIKPPKMIKPNLSGLQTPGFDVLEIENKKISKFSNIKFEYSALGNHKLEGFK